MSLFPTPEQIERQEAARKRVRDKALRDQFACAALIALPHFANGSELSATETARSAYRIASCMMAESERAQ